MSNINFICNNRVVNTELPPSLTLLDFLRQELALKGTKEGCREGDCGACTVILGSPREGHIKYETVNSCLLPMAAVQAKHVITIEGINHKDILNTLQGFMAEEGAAQCGFCTPGFMMSFTGYFLEHKKPYSIDALVNYLEGNICRCTGHVSIIKAAEKAVYFFNTVKEIEKNKLLLPEYFSSIPDKLKQLHPVVFTNDKKKEEEFFVGGGTDLYVQKWEDIYSDEKELVKLHIGGDVFDEDKLIKVIGGTSVTEFMNAKLMNKYFPDIKNHFALFGSTPIRNLATIAGNIINASPIADLTSFLLAIDASVIIFTGYDEKKISLKNFFLGYKKIAMNPGDILIVICINYPTPGTKFSFEKISRRTYLDIASVNSSMSILVKDVIKKVHISAGGVAPIPLYLEKTRSFLLGKPLNTETVLSALEIAQTEISPISDARGSADYKRELLNRLIIAHFTKLFPEQIRMEEFAL